VAVLINMYVWGNGEGLVEEGKGRGYGEGDGGRFRVRKGLDNSR